MGVVIPFCWSRKTYYAGDVVVQRILRLCRDQAGRRTGRIGCCRAVHDKEVVVASGQAGGKALEIEPLAGDAQEAAWRATRGAGRLPAA